MQYQLHTVLHTKRQNIITKRASAFEFEQRTPSCAHFFSVFFRVHCTVIVKVYSTARYSIFFSCWVSAGAAGRPFRLYFAEVFIFKMSCPCTLAVALFLLFSHPTFCFLCFLPPRSIKLFNCVPNKRTLQEKRSV